MADIDKMLGEIEGYGQASDAQNALQVLERLEALGDLRPSEAKQLEALRAQQGQISDEIGRTDATYRGALQGATFRQADELYGLFGGDKEGSRAKNKAASEKYPAEYRAGETAGAVTSGLATGAVTAPYMTAGTAMGTLGRGMLAGGLEGVLWGSGTGEGAKDKLQKAANYGGIGAGVAAVAPVGVWGAKKAASAVGDVIGGAFGLGNKGRANRMLMDTMKKAGTSGDDVVNAVRRAALEGQPEFRAMDAMGKAGMRRASGVARAGGDGAEEIAEFLEKRQLGQPERVGAFVDDAFQTKGTTAQRTRDALTAERGRVADAAYTAAREGASPVDVRGVVSVIDDRLGPTQGNEWAREGIDGMFQKYRDRLVKETAEGATELSDFSRVLNLKQDLQTEMKGLVGTPAYRELKKIESALDEALEGASDAYRFANDNYREASRVIESVDTGSEMAMRGRATDNLDTFGTLNDQQKRAARVGYGDKMLEKIERQTAPTSDRSKLFRSPKVEQEAAEIAVDPDLFARRIGRERQMWETQNRALGGSRTTDNLADVEDIGVAADALRAGQQAASGNIGNMLVEGGRVAGRIASGQNEGTRALVAQALMAQDPEKAIAAAIAQHTKGQRNSRAMEAVLRALLRGATSESPDQVGMK